MDTIVNIMLTNYLCREATPPLLYLLQHGRGLYKLTLSVAERHPLNNKKNPVGGGSQSGTPPPPPAILDI